MNILKLQDGLKNLSDEQLAQEMRLPSGSTPQYLIMTEMQRREKMRAEFSGSEPPKTTMAEEMSGEAPPPQGGMPPGGQDANAQGLMGMPDETMAGNAMRARISGQPQQIDGMTALPPQAMAVGGAVQFGNPFAGAQMGSAPSSTGYAPIQRYTYTAPPPPPAPDYTSMLRGLGFNPRGVQGSVRPAKPPVVQKPPVGTAVPVRGRPAQNRGPIRRASDGGPIYAAGGIFTGQPYTPSSDPTQMSDDELLTAASSKDAAQRDPATAELDRRNSQSRIGRMGGDFGRAAANITEKIPYVAPYMYPPTAVPALLNKIVGGTSDYLSQPGTPITVPRLSGRDIPGAADAMSEYQPPTQLAVPEDIGRGANAPEERPMATGLPRGIAPMSAPVSGPSDKAEKGIASLPPGPKGMTYEDYMRQANELIGGGREDDKTAKDRAFNNALMQLGLGMASSKNQSTLGAIAEGGIPALQGYSEAEAQRRKDDRALVGERLATLGVGAQMSQAEAKAADERAYREADAEIRRSEVAARRDDARLTRAQRDVELDLRRLQLEAEIFNANNPESRRVAERAYGPEGSVIAERLKTLNVLSDNLVAQQKTARDALAADPTPARQEEYDFVTTKLNEVNKNYEILASTGKTAQSSTTPGPLKPGFIPNTR